MTNVKLHKTRSRDFRTRETQCMTYESNYYVTLSTLVLARPPSFMFGEFHHKAKVLCDIPWHLEKMPKKPKRTRNGTFNKELCACQKQYQQGQCLKETWSEDFVSWTQS